jgi:hypothetical protein
MAGEESRVASAYLDIKARKAFANEELRRLGHEAGREFERGYEAEVDKGVAAGRAKRAAQGKQVGADIGDPAGKEAGARTSAGISDSLARSRGRTRKDGEDLGAVLGAAVGTRAGRSTTEGISTRLKASYGSFEKDGARLGDVLGAAMGDHAAGLTRKAIRRELEAESKIRARESAVEVRAANAALRAQEKAAATAARLAAREARDRATALKVAERETEKAGREAEKAQAERLGRLAKISARIGSTTRGGVLAAGGVGGLASAASSLGTVLAGTVGAVAQLSGALALLPAAGVAAGLGLAAFKVGIHDVGKALSDSGDPKKYAEDLKKLSPAARLFTKAVVALKPELKALRNEVQEGLFKGLDKQVTALGQRYIPILSRGLTGITKGFNGGAVAVGKFLDSSKSSQQVAGILDNTSRASANLGKAFKPVVQGLLDLTSVGAGFLPKLTENIGEAATRLSKFLDTAHRSGELRSFIQGGIDGFKELGKVAVNAGRILGGIFGAGGGAKNGALAALASLLGGVADQIARPEFQKGLGNFFASIQSAGASVGGALPKVADALVALEPAISKLVSGSGTAFAAILTSTANAAIALAPTLNVLAGALASLAPHAGAIVIALLAVKGALAGLKVAADVAEALDVFNARLVTVGLRAETATGRLTGLSGAMGAVGAAAAVVTVAALATELGKLSGRADVAAVNTDRLATSLQGLGTSGELGGEGLKLFADKGAFGLITNGADTSKVALDRFGTAAYNALDKGWDARLGRFQSFGQAQAGFRKQTEQLDGAFSNLAGRGKIDAATTSFERFIAAGVKAGVPVASLKAQFPQFSAALRNAGLTVDNTTGKVVVLSGALRGLPASKTVRINAQGMTAATARAYALQAALKRLPTNKVVTVTTRFFQVGKEPGTFGNGLGVFKQASGGQIPQRRAGGGLLDPRLGGRREDNVPLLASGGEFVMNAYATAAKGVLPLLRYINAANKLPQKLAGGGQVVGRASAGLGDLSASQPARVARIEASRTPAVTAGPGIDADAIGAAVAAAVAREIRKLTVRLDTGQLAGAVFTAGGGF